MPAGFGPVVELNPMSQAVIIQQIALVPGQTGQGVFQIAHDLAIAGALRPHLQHGAHQLYQGMGQQRLVRIQEIGKLEPVEDRLQQVFVLGSIAADDADIPVTPAPLPHQTLDASSRRLQFGPGVYGNIHVDVPGGAAGRLAPASGKVRFQSGQLRAVGEAA